MNSLDQTVVSAVAEASGEADGQLGYRTIYNRLQEDIRTLKLGPGSTLPSLRTLCSRYSASMMTVRHALDLLAAEGVIDKQHGRGNFVRMVRKLDVALLTASRYHREPLTSRLVRDLNANANGFELTPACLPNLGTPSVRHFQAEHKTPCLLLATSGFDAMASDDLLVPLDDQPGFQAALQDLPRHLDYRHTGGDGLARHYWLPLFLHPTAFALNVELARQCGLPVDRSPEDWDELLDWSAAFQRWARGRPGDLHVTYGLHSQVVTPNLSYLAMSGGDGRFSSDMSELSRATIEDFITLFARLSSTGAVVVSPAGAKPAYEPFVDGNYLFYLSALPWFAHEVQRYNPTLSCGFFPLPPKQRGGPRISNCCSVRLAIAKPLAGGPPEVMDAAWEACRALFHYGSLSALASDLKSLPARLSCHTAVAEANPHLEGFYNVMAEAQFAPGEQTALRRRFAADAFLTPFLVGRRMLDEPATIARLLRDMINHMDWDPEPL